jgi:hypothetical protein
MNDTCAVDDCDKPKYQGRKLCCTHTMRKHRYGDVNADRSRAGRTWNQSHGYQIRTVPGHPLADARGAVYVHRLTLFDTIGPGTHACRWCHNPVTWGVDLEADHVNHQRDDNRPANLVPSCHGCNTRRANQRRWHPPQGELQPDVVDVLAVAR